MSNMIIPDIAQTAITGLLDLLDAAFPKRISGFYITGSIALGDFQRGQSDIDFVGVTDSPFTHNELTMLSEIHRRFSRLHSKPLLDGIYVTWQQLATPPQGMDVPYYNEGAFHFNNRFGANPVTWCTLHKHTVRIRGPQNPFIFHDDNLLRNWCRSNLRSYWSTWIDIARKRPRRILNSLSRQAIAWGVLGVTRLHATIRSGDIISKQQAGHYAQTIFPVEWHRIIQTAMQIRSTNSPHLYRNIFRRRLDALAFMSMVVCNASDSIEE